MPANTDQARQTISQMRQIIGQLQRGEAANVRAAQKLAQDEKVNQQVLAAARSPNYKATAELQSYCRQRGSRRQPAESICQRGKQRCVPIEAAGTASDHAREPAQLSE